MQWNYIAGFFDGEGSISHNGKGFRITISQTNKEVLDEIKYFTKIGNVITVKKRKYYWKDSWVYYIAKQEDALRFLEKVVEYLIVKRELAILTRNKLKKIVRKMEEKADKRMELYKKVRNLRKQRLTYREIGKMCQIDFGYARRIVKKYYLK